MTVYQPTKNPYAGKPTYGKDVCELMRRVNALESRTVPRQTVGWTVPDGEDAPGDWWMCTNAAGTVTYFISHTIILFGSLIRYDIRVWKLDTSGSGITLSASWGTVTDPGGYYERDRYPGRPQWCCCDGSNSLWIRARWCHDSRYPADNTTTLIKVTSGGATFHNVSGSGVVGLTGYRQNDDSLGYGLLGYWVSDPGGFRTRDGISYAKPISGGGFEVHSAGGYTDALDGQHPMYQIEKYSTSAVLEDIKVYSRPGASCFGHGMGATDDYFSFFDFTPDNYGGWDGIGPGLMRRDACPLLDLSKDYAEPGSTIKGKLIPPAPADSFVDSLSLTVGGGNSYLGCVGSSAENLMLTQYTAGSGNGWSGSPTACIARLSSVKVSGVWTHTVRFTRRLGYLGPYLSDAYGRMIATDRTGDIIGLTTWGTDVWRAARWRYPASAAQTEWFAYQPDGAKESLGEPDCGWEVPADNALVVAGALPAPEHVIDMRNALITLVDDHFVALFREPRLPSKYASEEWCIAAWDYWTKWAGKHTSWWAWPDDPFGEPDTVPNRVKPLVYVALAHAHSKDRKYRLLMEENQAEYSSNPQPEYRIASKYYRFRKGEDTDMDGTPMHDVDIGEVRALVDFLEDSYNNIFTFKAYTENWMPWGNGDNGCPFGGGG